MNPWLDVRDYGAIGDGVADDAAAFQAALDDAAGTGQNEVKAPTGFWALGAPLTLKNYVTLSLSAGCVLKCIQPPALGVTMFTSSTTIPLLQAGVVGEWATIDPNFAADVVFDLHSPQLSTFGGFRVLYLRSTATPPAPGERGTGTVISIRADCTTWTDGEIKSNAGLNRFFDIIAEKTCDVGVELWGPGVSGVTTLNTFDNLSFRDVRVTGVRFIQWCDNNLFSNFCTINLRDDNARGVVFNDSATPPLSVGAYCNHFENLAIERYGPVANTKSLVFNYSRGNILHNAFLDPECATVIEDNYSQGHWIRRTGISGSNLTKIYEKGVIYEKQLTASVTYDPPSLLKSSQVTTTMAVPGAAVGDFVMPSFSLDLQAMDLSAWVSAAGVVSLKFQNDTNGTINLGSGTLKALVMKA